MPIEKDVRFWDRASRKYAAAPIKDPDGYDATLRRTRELLAPGDHVLELGCGTGTTALRLADAVAAYTATDISAAMIAIARERLRASPAAGLVFEAASAETLSGAGPFGAVLGFNYLHLVRDLTGTLQCIYRLLEPGGLFISKTPCLASMNPLIRRVLIPALRAIGKAPHVTSFSEAGLAQQLRDAGFDIVAVEHHGGDRPGARPYIVARKADGPV